jgi:sirohydrochlorin ferrochelatase
MKRAILLVDHGSRRQEANAVLEELASRLQERVPERIVRYAHLSAAPPSVPEAMESCIAAGAQEVVVHPYFLAPGSHSTHDIPRLVEEAAARHPGVRFRVTPPLGVDARLVDLILERVEQL